MALFWVVAPCSLVSVYRRFRGACCLQQQGGDRPDDGGSKHLWNVGKLLQEVKQEMSAVVVSINDHTLAGVV
jgi:hypothetical protein